MSEVWSTFFAAVGGVLVFRSVNHIIQSFFGSYSFIFILVGFVLFWYSRKLGGALPLLDANAFRVIAGVLVFVGISPYIDGFVGSYWWLALLFGLVLVRFNKEIGRGVRNAF